MIRDNQKFCTHCQTWKAFDGFSKHAGHSDGLMSVCRECRKLERHGDPKELARQKTYDKKRRQQPARREYVRLSSVARRQTPQHREYTEKYYQNNKEHIDGRNREWKKAHPEQVRQAKRLWHTKQLIENNF